MTSKLKCPFCGGEFDIISIKRKMLGCPKCLHIADGAFWKKAIQAKQDLETARDAITDVFSYVKEHEKDIGGCAVNIVIKLGLALTQITHDNNGE